MKTAFSTLVSFALLTIASVEAAPSSETSPSIPKISPAREGKALLGLWSSEYDPILKGVITLKINEVSRDTFKGEYFWSDLIEEEPYKRNVEGTIRHNNTAGYDELMYASSEHNIHALAMIPGELVGFVRDISTLQNKWPVILKRATCQDVNM